MAEWYKENDIYHIYPLGLLGCPAANPVSGHVAEPTDKYPVSHKLPMLTPWLDHIRELGCGAIYIGPLFESSAHGYDTIDYKLVDRRLGDNKDFKSFVNGSTRPRHPRHSGRRIQPHGP